MSDEIQYYGRQETFSTLRDIAWYINIGLRLMAFIPVAIVIIGLALLHNLWDWIWG